MNGVNKQVIQTGGGSGTPGGADTQIQFNDGGVFGGDARLYFDKSTGGATGGDFGVEAGASVDGYGAGFYAEGGREGRGGQVQAYSGNGITTDSNGGDFAFTAGSSGPGTGNGGSFSMYGGGAVSGFGGGFTLGGGTTSTGVGGALTLQGGSAYDTGDGGLIYFQGGSANGGIGGNVEFQPGAGGTKGKFLFRQTSGAYAGELDLESLTQDIKAELQNSSGVIAYISQIGKDEFGLTVDGAGAVVTTGSKGFRYMGYDGTITGWNVTSDVSGSIVFDIKRSGVSIAGTEKPTLSSQSSNSDLTLTTWTTAITAGDELEFIVDSASTVTRATLTILITKAP